MAWKLQLRSVWRVLLADGWHDVAPNQLTVSTFDWTQSSTTTKPTSAEALTASLSATEVLAAKSMAR